jgi:hypothetical protein
MEAALNWRLLGQHWRTMSERRGSTEAGDNHFRYWHEPDLQCCPQFGRYQGESGRDADRPIR